MIYVRIWLYVLLGYFLVIVSTLRSVLSSLELMPIMDFFCCFLSDELLYRMEDEELCGYMGCGRCVAKQSIISGYVLCSILILIVKWNFQSFQNSYCLFTSTRKVTTYVISKREILLLIHFYKISDFAITPSLGVILCGYFYKRGARQYK